MPERLVRWQREGDLHFVTFSCYQRLPYLRSAAARDHFVAALEWARERDHMDVVGYVVMPEHVHLLVGEPERCLLSQTLQSLKLSVAKTMQAYPKLWWHSAHLSRKERGEDGARSVERGKTAFWTRRYYDANLCTHDAMVECLRYLHRNPIKRGLVQEPEAWRWSSYRHYYLREVSPIQLDSAWAFENQAGNKTTVPHLREAKVGSTTHQSP